MRFVTTRAVRQARGGPGGIPAVSLAHALFAGLGPDGGLYVPESIPRWSEEALASLAGRSLIDLGTAVLSPFAAGEVADATLRSVVAEALDFPMPLVSVEPGVHALELFHGPTLAFKDVAARVMARLMAVLHDGGAPVTILVATSGDTGSAVGSAFHGVASTRVVILYPDGRVSPTQESQLAMFNGEPGSNVHAYAVGGSFDECQALVKQAFADPTLGRGCRLSSANSINVGRLLPQMIYYFHGVAQLWRADLAQGRPAGAAPVIATPSGNFGNLTAGLMAKRTGLPIARFVAATNVNDVVPGYLATGRFEPRASVRTLANAMDVGNPSNFERMLWLYDDSLEAMRRDVAGRRYTDEDVRATIRRVHEERGYLLDPHSAIGYLGLKDELAARGTPGQAGIFVGTAHPAKFSEIIEPVIGGPIAKPAALASALARPLRVTRMPATLDAVRDVVMGSRSRP